jgi:hypothetical protein
MTAATASENDTPEVLRAAQHAMPKPSPSISAGDSTQTAKYIADFLLELRSMARGASLPHLAYFLEMAFYEAFNQANKNK